MRAFIYFCLLHRQGAVEKYKKYKDSFTLYSMSMTPSKLMQQSVTASLQILPSSLNPKGEKKL